MFYELAISIGSVLFSYVVYVGFFKFFQSGGGDVIFDRRDDLELDGKEILLVTVVRGILYHICYSTSPAQCLVGHWMYWTTNMKEKKKDVQQHQVQIIERAINSAAD